MIRTTAPDGLPLSDLAPELQELERRLRVELGAGGSFLRAEGLRLLDSGGKRLRPAMALAAAHLGAYDRERALPVAAAIELIHMATLVHDDVIDAAPTRRGSPTTYARHGAHAAVYAGDWLLVKALRSLAAVEDAFARSDGGAGRRGRGGATRRSPVPDALVAGLESLIGGEVEQYVGRGRLPSVRTYLSRIERKTAALFEAACAAGAATAGLPDDAVKASAAFGRAYGIAFQIHDDLLDVSGSARAAGKPLAHDLRQGIATLPYLLAAKKDAAFRTRLQAYFRAGAEGSALAGPEEARRLTAEMRALGGDAAARGIARTYADEAESWRAKLPDAPGRAMLAALARLPD